jgi:hypothetical protein
VPKSVIAILTEEVSRPRRTIRAMTRHGDPLRIDTARREAAVARLIGEGHGSERARVLVAEWVAGLGRPPSRSDWERFDAWVMARRSGGSEPSSPSG